MLLENESLKKINRSYDTGYVNELRFFNDYCVTFKPSYSRIFVFNIRQSTDFDSINLVTKDHGQTESSDDLLEH